MKPIPWYKNAIFYEVYIRAFADGNGDGHGDLPGLTANLDYLKQLGVDCLWIMPMYPSPLKDDGYDISDFYSIHPDYGNLEDFIRFLEAAHARGMRVITDLVVNHTSDQHPWFQSARADRNSPYRNYYVWSDDSSRYSDARIIFLDTENSNWTWDEVAGQYFWHRFYASQPDLNYDNPAVQAEMLKVMDFWLELGVDGFRVDAVPYLYEREGTICENLPETHAYLRKMRKHVEEKFPQCVLLCEANQWPADVRAYFGEGDEFHMAFHFPVMPRLYKSLALADRSPIEEILAMTPEIPESCQWCTFLRNHDELTLEMVTPEERAFLWERYAPEPRMRLNLGIRRRLAPLLGGSRSKIELLKSILFTLPGAPILYYGDEIGMGENIWLPDRDGVRTPMQWTAGLNAGFSAAPPERLYAQPIADPRYGYTQVNVAAMLAQPRSLLVTLQRMIAVRKQNRVFGCGSYAILPTESKAILAVQRRYQGEEILAIHNLSGVIQTVRGVLDLDPSEVILASENLPKMGADLELPPYGYVWLRNRRETISEGNG